MKRCPFCAEDIQDAAIVCKHCGRDVPALMTDAPTGSPSRKTHKLRTVLIVVVGIFVLAFLASFINNTSSGPQALTAEHRAAILKANNAHAWIPPVSMEVSGAGVVVVDYEVATDVLIPPRTLGTDRLLAIREALLPFGFKDFRVNINGPKPGAGLVRRYGSARLFQGGSLEWLTP